MSSNASSLLVLVCWSALAAAAEPGAGPLDAPGEARAQVAWAHEGPDAADDLVDVAVSQESPDRIALVTGSGRVFVSGDGGVAWEDVLAPEGVLGDHSRAEDALLDVETRLNELLDDQNGYVDPDQIDPAATSDELIADVRSGTTVYERLTGAVAAFDLHPHLRWSAEWLEVARPDGVWRTADGGATWAHTLTEPVVMCEASRGITLCGGPGGAWLSTDGAQWVRSTSAPEVAVWSILTDAEGFLVGTTDGLFRTEDGVEWVSVDGPSPALALFAFQGTLRVSDGDTIWWRADGDPTWNRGPDILLAAVYDMAVSPAGNLYAAGKSGVLIATEGEVWRRVGDELRFEARALGFDREGVLAASDLGLMHGRHRPADRLQMADEAWIPLEHLLAAAEHRNGFNPKGGAVGPSGQAVLWLLPEIQLTYVRQWGLDYASTIDQGLDYDPTLLEGISVQATWRRPKYALNATDAIVDVDDQGDVNVYMSGGDNWMALGRISRRIALQRLKDAEEISALYQRRVELVRQVAAATGSVSDRAHLLLRVAELEARMDLMTDGAVRGYRAVELASGGEE